jgi:hypothetical protein
LLVVLSHGVVKVNAELGKGEAGLNTESAVAGLDRLARLNSKGPTGLEVSGVLVGVNVKVISEPGTEKLESKIGPDVVDLA